MSISNAGRVWCHLIKHGGKEPLCIRTLAIISTPSLNLASSPAGQLSYYWGAGFEASLICMTRPLPM